MAEIKSDGVYQGDLVSLLNKAVTLANELKADHNGVMTKLDADVLVGDTNYASLRSVAATDSAIGNIRGDGIHQGELYTFCAALAVLANEIKLDHNLTLAKLDADAGVSGTDYASLRTVSASDIGISRLSGTGLNWSDLWDFANAVIVLLNEIKADHNALLTKLDLDAGVTGTDYASLHTTAASDLSLVI